MSDLPSYAAATRPIPHDAPEPSTSTSRPPPYSSVTPSVSTLAGALVPLQPLHLHLSLLRHFHALQQRITSFPAPSRTTLFALLSPAARWRALLRLAAYQLATWLARVCTRDGSDGPGSAWERCVAALPVEAALAWYAWIAGPGGWRAYEEDVIRVWERELRKKTIAGEWELRDFPLQDVVDRLEGRLSLLVLRRGQELWRDKTDGADWDAVDMLLDDNSAMQIECPWCGTSHGTVSLAIGTLSPSSRLSGRDLTTAALVTQDIVEALKPLRAPVGRLSDALGSLDEVDGVLKEKTQLPLAVFLYVANDVARKGPLVPTVDIDFVWMTHMLEASRYRVHSSLATPSLASRHFSRLLQKWESAHRVPLSFLLSAQPAPRNPLRRLVPSSLRTAPAWSDGLERGPCEGATGPSAGGVVCVGGETGGVSGARAKGKDGEGLVEARGERDGEEGVWAVEGAEAHYQSILGADPSIPAQTAWSYYLHPRAYEPFRVVDGAQLGPERDEDDEARDERLVAEHAEKMRRLEL
ncbi:hypothetical protein Rhopal_007837-T1 [Rhodotorula paludigena]|uniref:Uncharacterized protein n=1 Tax=Rhodotorula paludigena TaxID=86838 RepID=A0AAV5GQ93_9BASI|nr:hypothetical protein Rhopal_007837-T1 [Rhodotorula paludigena]